VSIASLNATTITKGEPAPPPTGGEVVRTPRHPGATQAAPELLEEEVLEVEETEETPEPALLPDPLAEAVTPLELAVDVAGDPLELLASVVPDDVVLDEPLLPAVPLLVLALTLADAVLTLEDVVVLEALDPEVAAEPLLPEAELTVRPDDGAEELAALALDEDARLEAEVAEDEAAPLLPVEVGSMQTRLFGSQTSGAWQLVGVQVGPWHAASPATEINANGRKRISTLMSGAML
jgi:hypothetical protein